MEVIKRIKRKYQSHMKNNIQNFMQEKTKSSGLRFVILILLLMIVSSGASAVANPSEENVSPEAIEVLDNSVFGVEETPIYADGILTSGLSDIVNSKTKWVRGPDIVWSDIEATHGTYDWEKMQPAIDELDEIVNSGYTPIVVVRGTPTWAQIPDSSSCGPINAANYDEFGEFIQEAMDILDAEGISVQYWEIWNEPDVDPSVVPPDSWYSGCWGDQEDEDFYGGRRYSKMLTVVYQMIKAKDPFAQVLVGGLNLYCDPINPHPNCGDPDDAVVPAKFFAGILDDALGQNFDGVSFHAYDGYGGSYGKYGNVNWNSYWNVTGPSIIAKSIYLRNLMSQYGVYGKYLMSTETAIRCNICDDDSEFEATKANYLADSYASAIAYGIVSNIWFDILGTWGENNGLIDIETLEKLPAYDAYEHASITLEGASLVRPITEFDGVYGFEFKTPNPNYHVWTMRSIDGQNYTVQFTFNPYEITDVYGNDITDQLTSDNKIDVSVEPMYVVMPASVPRMALPLVMNNFKNFTNGDFEEGPVGWYFVNQGLPSSLVYENPTNPINGSPDTYIPEGDFSAILGDFGYNCFAGVPIGFGAVAQLFYVPDIPDTDVEMTFDYVIYTEDRAVGPPLEPNDYDRLEAYIITLTEEDLVFSDANKSSGSIACGTWHRVPGPGNERNVVNDGWARGTIDLNEYKGQSVYISFRNYNRLDNYYNTVSFIDNVELIVSNP